MPDAGHRGQVEEGPEGGEQRQGGFGRAAFRRVRNPPAVGEKNCLNGRHDSYYTDIKHNDIK